MKLTRARKAFFIVLMFGSAVSLVAVAQPKKPAAKPAPAAAAAKKPANKTTSESADASAAPTKETAEPSGASREPAKAGGAEQKSPDGGRVFRFGEVEVEGRLKSPQIVYFLRRIRAEFAAGDLGHRSFMTELGETKYEPAF
jgi:hypothetical protein